MTAAANHVALFTPDLDALVDFYVDVFDAEIVGDWGDGSLRHAFIEIGRDTTLHPVQVTNAPPRRDSAGHFGRRRAQVAITAPDADEFEGMRRRLVELGASDGRVTRDANERRVWFIDPGGSTGVIIHFEGDEGHPQARAQSWTSRRGSKNTRNEETFACLT